MDRKRYLTIFLLLTAFGCRGICFSQEAAGVFDLQQVMDYALQNNLDLRVAERQKAAAEAEINAQRELNNPSLVGETTRSQPNYFVGAGYVFELGGKRAARIRLAQSEAAIAGFNLDTGKRDLIHDVRLAFYDLIRAQGKLRQVKTSADLAGRLLAVSKERFDAGDAPRLEVLQTELEFKKRENEVQQAETDSNSARVRLNALLNRDPQAPLQPHGGMEDTIQNQTLSALVDQAFSNRPEIRSVQAEEKAQQERLSLARKENIPDLQAEGGTEIHDQDFQFGWRASLSFDIPLFNQHQGEIAGANATLQSLQAQENSQKQKVKSEVTENFLKFQTTADRKSVV